MNEIQILLVNEIYRHLDYYTLFNLIHCSKIFYNKLRRYKEEIKEFFCEYLISLCLYRPVKLQFENKTIRISRIYEFYTIKLLYKGEGEPSKTVYNKENLLKHLKFIFTNDGISKKTIITPLKKISLKDLTHYLFFIKSIDS